jgi:ABC-2 type transport system ATP-binding protein
MKRRVLIAKALAMSRGCCFWTNPPRASTWSCAATCGRWREQLKADGVTIILTTHYLEEAEAIADRVGVINKGEILLVEETRP